MSYIVTINREYGSGGHEIGKIIAGNLGIPFYDKALIAKTSEKSGFTEEFVKEINEKKTMSLLYSLYMTSMPLSDRVFIAQSQVIEEIAKEGSALIIGGCADYVLREHPKCFNAYIYAPFEVRLKRVSEVYKEGGEDPGSYLRKCDKKRISYYNYFTQNKWAKADNYNLSIDSSLGISQTAEIITMAVKTFISNST